MIAHRTFTVKVEGWTVSEKHDRCEIAREQAQAFISQNGLSDERIVNITETYLTYPSSHHFVITVWYREQ